MTHLPAAGRREPRELSPGSWKDNSGKTTGREGRVLPSWGIESPGTETGKATHMSHMRGMRSPLMWLALGTAVRVTVRGQTAHQGQSYFKGQSLYLNFTLIPQDRNRTPTLQRRKRRVTGSWASLGVTRIETIPNPHFPAMQSTSPQVPENKHKQGGKR